METLKILVFNWRCWLNPNMGGAEVFTHEVLKRWVNAGHEAVLFTSMFDGGKREEITDGVRIIRDGGAYTVYRKAKKFYEKISSKEKFDIVIDEINTKPFQTPKFVKNGEKIVALIHQLAKEYWFYETFFPINYLGYYVLEKRWLRNYFKIPTFTVSESTRKDLVDMGFRKVFVVGEGLNFTPLDKISEKEEHPVIVYVGRLKKAKRPDYAIAAFKVVKEKIPEAELWLIGNGYLREKLMKTAPNGVRFYTNLQNDDRRKLIRKSWVLVNPSVREGFGLNVIEANALGVPCIAYDVSGLRDAIIDNRTGLLVKSGTAEALAEAIVYVLTDDSFRLRLSQEALKHSRSFSWDNVADKFIELIKAM